MYLEKQLQKAIQKALKTIYSQDIPIEKLAITPTPAHFTGTHTLTTFPLVKDLHQKPEKIATQLGEYLTKHDDRIAHYQVAKGFLNLQLTDQVWINSLEKLEESIDKPLDKPQKIVIEFSSPNTNKPLHLGHLRNNFLGHSLAQMLQALGHQVYKVSTVNDRGIHICKSMLAYKKWGNGKTPSTSGVKGDRFVGNYYVLFEKAYQKQVQELTQQIGDKEKAKKQAPLLQEAQAMLAQWELGNQEVIDLWKKMNAWVYKGFDHTYKKINIGFDQIDHESETYQKGKKLVEKGLQQGVFYQAEDQSIWTDLTAKGLDKKLLIRPNGTSVYITQDIGLIQERYQTYNFDKHIYVVGNEQNYHFKVFFTVLEQLKKPYAKRLEHLSYGMVDLPSGKMKSREGTTVDADDLINKMLEAAKQQTALLGKIQDFSQDALNKLHHTIALGALKYFLLKVHPQKNILFDPKESIDLQGHTGPFIQYAYARIQTLLTKAKPYNYTSINSAQSNTPLHPSERELIVQLTRFRPILHQAAQTYNPSLICQYAYNLAKTYNRMYASLPIIHEQNIELRTRRFYLSMQTAYIIKKATQILGITLPKKM